MVDYEAKVLLVQLEEGLVVMDFHLVQQQLHLVHPNCAFVKLLWHSQDLVC